MGGVGCVVNASDATPEVVKDLADRLGATMLAVRGAVNLPALSGKEPASTADGAAPGVTLSADDAELRRALDAARSAGLDPYLVFANPLVGAPEWTALLAKDSRGHVATEIVPDRPPLCPNNKKLLKWVGDAAGALIETYRPAGVLVDDVSLGPPWTLDALFTCWCDVCEARITELGYDVDRIRVGILGARSRFEEAALSPAAFNGCGIGQYLEAVGYDTGLLDWLNYRADCVSSCLYEIRQALAGADATVRVTIVSKAPTVAMLAGQRRSDLLRDTTLTDLYAPVIAGPGSGVLQTLAGHAESIGAAMAAGSEADAVALAATLHGCAGLPLPESPEELAGTPSAELLIASARHELELTMTARGNVPRWPAIDVSDRPGETVEAVAGLVAGSEADGILYLGVAH